MNQFRAEEFDMYEYTLLFLKQLVDNDAQSLER